MNQSRNRSRSRYSCRQSRRKWNLSTFSYRGQNNKKRNQLYLNRTCCHSVQNYVLSDYHITAKINLYYAELMDLNHMH